MTLVFKCIKTTTELICVILLRPMVLLVVINLKYLFSFTQCQTLRRRFSTRLSLWRTLIQSSVLAASSCSTECSLLLEQTKHPRKRGLVPLMSQAVVSCLASRSPNSYSPCVAPIFSPRSPRGAGVWLRVLRFLLVRQAAKAKEPTGDLGEGLQLGGAGHLISGKTPIFSMVTLNS